MLDGKSREATALCTFGYYDGKELEFFEGKMCGKISTVPSGENGYGWDKIFIPDGYDVTRASLSEEDYQKTYLQIKPFEKVKNFLLSKAL
jgi:inosine/xanthosine triphosphate pyrophosphatase family protein